MDNIIKKLNEILNSSMDQLYSLNAAVITSETIANTLADSIKVVSITPLPVEDTVTINRDDVIVLKQLAAEIKVLYTALKGMEKELGEKTDELERLCWRLENNKVEE